MSAVLAFFDRRGADVDPALFKRLMASLDHRGRDGRATVVSGALGLGFQSFVTTSEGRSGLIHDAERGIDLLFEGRIDNRDELFRDLDADCTEDASDAELMLLAYRRWHERAAARVIGPFAVVVYERRPQRLFCARDALGDRSLYYISTPRELVVASEPATLLLHPAVSEDLDESSLARFFAVEPPSSGRTFFRDVRELPPGRYLIADRERLRLERYWPPENLESLDPGNDGQRIEQFRSTLFEAVRCRLRGTTRPRVLMSGGLDSTSVAAIAALEKPGTTAISWVFHELERADERPYSRAMVEACGLDWRPIRADDEWPLRELPSWPVSLNAPWQGLYCRLQNAAYRTASQDGERVLLTGELGDHLYVGAEHWLRDLWREGRRSEAVSYLGNELLSSPLALFRASATRSAVARALGWRGRKRRVAPWLTRHAQELRWREDDSVSGFERLSYARPAIVDSYAAHAASLETPNAARKGIEVRRPFRDRRLVELMLSLPAHLVYRSGSTKYVLREAMAGVLPEIVRARRQVTSLIELAARGLVEREAPTVARLLTADGSSWRRFVREGWLSRSFPDRLKNGLDGVETAIAWQCVCFELWMARLGRRSVLA